MKNEPLPLTFRAREVKSVSACLLTGNSCQIVGIGSVGKSNLLRFLLREDVRRAKLGAEWKKYIFVYVDGNKLLENSEWGLWELMLHQILAGDSSSVISPEDYKKIDEFHRRAIEANTRHIALRYLDRAIGVALAPPATKIVFLLDEFDELYRTLPAHTLDALRALRDDYKYRLMYVVATRKELKQIRGANEHREALEELVTPHTIWLSIYSKADAQDALSRFTARYRVTLSDKQRQNILAATGGHPGLIRAVFPALQENPRSPLESLYVEKSVVEECWRIWLSLTKEEQKTLILLSRRKNNQGHVSILNNLINKGLLKGEWTASITIFSPLFSKFLLEESLGDDPRIRIDRQKHEVWIDERPLEAMPPLEYKLLEYLEARRGQVCSREQIVQHLYPNAKISGVSGNAIDSIVKRLRKRIETNNKKPEFIVTIHGVGFRLKDGENEFTE